MPNINSSVDHVYLHNKMTGGYRDGGEAKTIDRVLSWVSCGAMKIAKPSTMKPCSGAGVAADTDSVYVGSKR